MKKWFENRGIFEQTLKDFNISWDYKKITIPVNNTFNKYRRLPHDESNSKYWYDKGSQVSLFGLTFLQQQTPENIKTQNNLNRVVITEGELDAMVLHSHGLRAVSSTGGCSAFSDDWVKYFDNFDVYICFDNDKAGQKAMAKMYELFPKAFFVFIPEEARIKDISDYYERGGCVVRLINTGIQFKDLSDIEKDKEKKHVIFQDYTFHKEILNKKIQPFVIPTKNKRKIKKGDFQHQIEQAKLVPFENYIDIPTHRKVKCWFHNEKTASMYFGRSIEGKPAYFKCYGCNKWGSIIDLVMHRENLNFVEAVKYINKNL